jgi:hypothetical protein
MKTKEIIVANTDADFDVLFRESALVAVFMTAADYEQFSDKNMHLTDEMEAVVGRLFVKAFADEHIGVGYDWWPDHTRSIECDIQCFNQELFDAVCALLVNEYDEWRIQVVVYDDVMKGTTMIGSVTIWSNKFLLDRQLYEWMSGKGFNFGTTAKPRFVDIDQVAIREPRSTLLDDVE